MSTVLLGNGFSRAFDNTRFDYAALYRAVRFPDRLTGVFDTLGTRDFETVLRRLDQFLELLPSYNAPGQVRRLVRDDRAFVRRSLIQALRDHHPDGPWTLTDAESLRCAQYLRRYNQIFTVNYDLLLYWVIVQHLRRETDDGFRGSTSLTWQGENPTQCVFYLHGGLHLWEDADKVRKLRYEEGETLLDQLTAQLDAGRYPLFVSEGTSAQKRARIRGNDYLAAAYAALRANDEPLVIYGMRLGNSDKHIIDAIGRSQTPSLTITHWDQARRSDIDRLTGIGHSLAARINTTLGTRVPVEIVPASTVFQWR